MREAAKEALARKSARLLIRSANFVLSNLTGSRIEQSDQSAREDARGIRWFSETMCRIGPENGFEFESLYPEFPAESQQCVWCKRWIQVVVQPVSSLEGSTCFNCCQEGIKNELKKLSQPVDVSASTSA